MIARLTALLLALSFHCCAPFAHAEDAAALARELVTLKGGYADKKKHFDELRIRAYIPILLKATGKGPAWKPGHANWHDTEQRIAGDWRKHYLDYLARLGRDTNYLWMDDALTREYARQFTTEELGALLAFYRSAPGGTLLALEKEFLGFYPDALVRSLARVMFGNETLSAQEQEWLRAPQSRERRAFVALFEMEAVLIDECARIGDQYVEGSFPAVPQGVLATAAGPIDTLRRKLDAGALAALRAFLQSAIGRKERAFIGAALPAVTPTEEDPARAKEEEAAFYKGLRQLSAQWRELAASTAAK